MNTAEMVSFTKTLSGDTSIYVSRYVDLAKGIVVKRLFPYKENASWSDVPINCHEQTCQIAAYLINKRGAEGETAHSESNVSRTYESASVPASMFVGMTPFAGVPK